MVSEQYIPNYEPIITEIPQGWEFGYIEADSAWPTIQIKNLTRDRYSNLVCDFTAFCLSPDTMTPLTSIKFNVSSLKAREGISRGLRNNYLSVHATWIDWRPIINDLCLRIVKIYNDGLKVEDIWPSTDIIPPQFLLEPLLPLHQPTIIFGDGGSGKGHIAMVAGILAQLPFYDNKLRLATQSKPTNTLYLDYEADRSDFERTLSGICNGFGINIGLKRLVMAQPLSECAESLRNKVNQDNIGFLIIDSLGLAAGGDINTAESANKFWAALKTIPNITTLIVAHNSKDLLTKKKTIYGSVFFQLIARSVWECKKSQEPDSSEMVISLTHNKFNRKRQLPLGFNFNFDDSTNTISIARCDLKDTELASEFPLKLRIKALLSEEGKLDAKSIAEYLTANEDSIRAELNRQKRLFVKVENEWGLLSNDKP